MKIYFLVFFKSNFHFQCRYLEKRFESRAVRLFAATCFILLTCLYLAIVVYAPSLALSQVTGLNIDLSIVLTFAVCIFYTSIGGIKAVIWTNVFQVRLNNYFRHSVIPMIELLSGYSKTGNFDILGSLHAYIMPCRGCSWK